MKNLLKLLIPLIGLLHEHAFANLNETESQIAKRYGPPCQTTETMFKNETIRKYRFRGREAMVEFLEGKSCSEWHTLKHHSRSLVNAEIHGLLEGDSSGGTWRRGREPGFWVLINGDGKVVGSKRIIAMYETTPAPANLWITTEGFRDLFFEQFAEAWVSAIDHGCFSSTRKHVTQHERSHLRD